MASSRLAQIHPSGARTPLGQLLGIIVRTLLALGAPERPKMTGLTSGTTNLRYITEAEVERVLQAGPLTDALAEVFLQVARGEAAQRPRDRVVLGKFVQHSLAAISQAWGLSCVKTYSTGPQGVTFVTLLFSLSENRLLATIESARMGQLRTGCATALAVRHLCAGPVRLALFGTGTVAQGQLEALGPRLERARVYGRDFVRCQEFCRRMGVLLKREVEPASSSAECLDGADLVVTATTSSKSVFSDSDLGPSGVLCAVGSNWARKAEVDCASVERCAEIWVDDLEQARIEAGELLQFGAPPWERCRSLAELVSGAARASSGWTLFKSMGVGLEDLASAKLVYDQLHA